MKNNKKRTMILTSLVCLLPMIMTFVLYDQLPEQVPINFNMKWEPSGYAPKALAGFGMPVLLTIINLFLHSKISNDPKFQYSTGFFKGFCLWIMPIFSVFITPLSLFSAMGYHDIVRHFLPSIFGVTIIIIGNYLPKCRQNYLIGIRIPWTLKDEDNWNKTHHIAGYLWMIGGLAILLYSWTGMKSEFYMITVMFILVIVPIVYSFLLWMKREK